MKHYTIALFLVLGCMLGFGQSESSITTHFATPTLEISAGSYLPFYPSRYHNDVSLCFNGGSALLLGCDLRTEHGHISLTSGIRVGNHHYRNPYYEMNALFWSIPINLGYQYDIGSRLSIYGHAGILNLKVASAQLQICSKPENTTFQQQVDEELKNRDWGALQVETGMNWQFHCKLSLRVALFSDIPFASTWSPYMVVAYTMRPILGLKIGLKWNVLDI